MLSVRLPTEGIRSGTLSWHPASSLVPLLVMDIEKLGRVRELDAHLFENRAEMLPKRLGLVL
jgi:hypothetical protein